MSSFTFQRLVRVSALPVAKYLQMHPTTINPPNKTTKQKARVARYSIRTARSCCRKTLVLHSYSYMASKVPPTFLWGQIRCICNLLCVLPTAR